jgi:hypothetical protein
VTTPKKSSNTYVQVDGFPAIPAIHDTVGNHYQKGFAGGTLKDMESNIASYVDSAGNPIAAVEKDAAGRTVYVLASGDTLRPKESTPLTFKGIKLMARASANLGGLFGMDESAYGPFRLFAEAAVLGVENQPYYYEKIGQRIPVMLGLDIPTFGLLDLVSVQLEYFKNPYPENSYQQYANTLPQPAFPSGNPALYEANRASGLYSEDDLKWSFYLHKNLYQGLDLFLQAANDHFRVQDVNAGPSFTPVTHLKADWYYLLQFQWSM